MRALLLLGAVVAGLAAAALRHRDRRLTEAERGHPHPYIRDRVRS